MRIVINEEIVLTEMYQEDLDNFKKCSIFYDTYGECFKIRAQKIDLNEEDMNKYLFEVLEQSASGVVNLEMYNVGRFTLSMRNY